MSRGMSSLRQPLNHEALLVGLCVCLLLPTGSAATSGGTTLPTPDDPPSGYRADAWSPTRRPAAGPDVSTVTVPPAGQAQLEGEPAPDAPPTPAVRQPDRAARRASTEARSSSVRPPAPSALSSATTPTPRATAKPTAVLTTTPNVAPRALPPVARPTPKPKPTQPAPVARRQRSPATPAIERTPHDPTRLGLPAGSLLRAASDDPARDALLVAAALLLAAAGLGGLVVGRATRHLARHA